MSLSSKIKKVRGTYVEPAKPVYDYKPVVKPDKNVDPSFKNTESFGRIPTPTIKSLEPKVVAPVVPVTKITRDKGTPSIKESTQRKNAKDNIVEAKVEKETKLANKVKAKRLETELSDKYGIDVKRANSPIEAVNMLSMVDDSQKEQFKKDFAEYSFAAERSNPFRAGAEAGFNVLPTNLEKTEGKEDVQGAKGYGAGRLVGGIGQQLAFNSALGGGIESLTSKLLPKATPFVAETIKDVAIGTGTQLAEAPFDKPTAGQFGANVALDIALNALFGVVGKGLSKLDLSNLKTAKPSQVVGEVAEKLNVSIVEADKVVDDAIDFYVNQSGVADTNQFDQLQLEAPKTKDLSDVSNTLSNKLRAKQSDMYVNQVDTKFKPANVVDGIKSKTLLHGTNADFKEFDLNKTGSFTGNDGLYGTGVYLTENPTYAKVYGDNVIQTKANVKKPFVIDREVDLNEISRITGQPIPTTGIYSDKASEMISVNPRQFSEELQKLGYDSVVVKGGPNQTIEEMVVFDTKNISTDKPQLDRPSDFSVKKPIYPTLDPKFAKERPSVLTASDVKRIEPTLNIASKVDQPTTTMKIEPTLKPKKQVEAKQPSDAKMKFRKTITNSFQKSQLSDEAKIVFDENPREYEIYTNPEQWEKAFDKVSSDVDGSIKTFNSKSALENADDTAEGIALMNRLSEADRIDELVDVASDFAERATNAGQAVQAIVMLQKTTPEGKLVQGFSIVNNAKKQLKDEMPALYNKLKKEGRLPEITPEDAKFIVDQMKKAQDLTGRAKIEAIGLVDQLLTDKMPVMFADKVRAVRNLSLLGNLKTLAARNPLGNAVFMGLENISQIPAGLTDKALSAWLKTNRTTKILPDIGVQLGGLKTGFKDAISDIKLGIDTSPVRGGAELPRSRKVFDESLATKINKLMGEPVKLAKFMEISWLNTANNWLGNALKLGDRPFYQAAYDLRMKELKELMPDADQAELEKIAIEFGKTRTFQNNSKTAQAFRKVKDTLNTANVKGFVAGDVVMPYTETPANIMAKGMEYTPFNILQLGKIALDSNQGGIKKNIAANQKQFADAAGRLFTGTGLIALGYNLRKNGYISGKNETKSSKVKNLKKDAGEQRYSIKIGDTWYSYDWSQPSATPMAVGADFYDAGANEEDVLTAIEKGTISGATTLLMQGVTQNLMRMFGGYSPVENFVETLSSAPTQFLPTLGNQTAQMNDEFKRDVNYKGSLGEQLADASKKRVPGLRETLPATLNMWGEPVKEQQGRTGVERAFDVFLNPSLKTSETKDPIIKEVNKVFEETKDTSVIPSYTPSALEKSEEIRNFKMIYGPMAKSELETLFRSSIYKGSREQNKLIKKVLDKLQDKAKDAYNLKYKTDLR